MLEVTVGDGPGRIVSRHKPVLDFLGVREAPHVRFSLVTVERSTNAHLGRVDSTHEAGVFGHYFREMGWPVAQAGSQGGERVEVMAQGLVDADSATGGLVECHHEGAEQTGRARDRLSDEAELAKYALPALAGYSLGN